MEDPRRSVLCLRRPAEVKPMYAIIESGGKQFKVTRGDVIDVERLKAGEGESVVFDRVLALKKDDGELLVGNPVVPGARAVGRIVGEHKARKVIVFKYKSKVNERKKRGHRQVKTKVVVEDIVAG